MPCLDMIAIALICGVFGYFMVHLIALIHSKRWLHRKIPQLSETHAHLGVSILKPIVGMDDTLPVNLESYFNLKYPKYEILISIAEPDGKSIPLVKALKKKYPRVDCSVFIGASSVGVNPKINNMLRAFNAAKYEVLWISDSGILTLPHTLTEMTMHLEDPKVGIVHQLPFTLPDSSFAGVLDSVYFGTQHARVCLCADVFKQNCANGMSWLIRKHALLAEGGLLKYSQYLAEDFFISTTLWKKGWKLQLSTLPAIQNSGHRSLRSYVKRIVRWGRLRASMMPWPGLLEPFTECLTLGVLLSLSLYQLMDWNPVWPFIGHVCLWFLLDMCLLKQIQNGIISPWWKVVLAWLLREVCTLSLFFASLWSRQVSWRGINYRLTHGGVAYKTD
ncbi:ceramide glucosyltransferase-like [Dysidea avara]|uniref:ceramide glucosyltransferase-like n=1 Tax=Dysidea avara TaxID=196820 RepID=UPI00331DDFE9